MKRVTIFDKYEKAGLTRMGKIKPNEACPYIKNCREKGDNCPTVNKYNHEFSCARCRLGIVIERKEL